MLAIRLVESLSCIRLLARSGLADHHAWNPGGLCQRRISLETEAEIDLCLRLDHEASLTVVVYWYQILFQPVQD